MERISKYKDNRIREINEIPEDIKPVVSVCMITYNHEKFIAEAIEGVLMQQTGFPIELVIGEDCSTDHTREICLEYQKKYPHIIRLLLPEKNLGMMPNFINTLKACRGEYIAFCEGDDCWIDEKKLDEQVNFLEKERGFSIHFFNSMSVDSNNNIIDKRIWNHDKSTFTIEDFLSFNPICTLTAICLNIKEIKTDHFEKIMLQYPYGDWPLWIFVLHNTKKKAKYDSKVVSRYRIHTGGACTSLSKLDSIKNVIKILKLNKCLYPSLSKKSTDQAINRMVNLYFKELKSQNKIKASVFYFLHYSQLKENVSLRDLFYILRKE